MGGNPTVALKWHNKEEKGWKSTREEKRKEEWRQVFQQYQSQLTSSIFPPTSKKDLVLFAKDLAFSLLVFLDLTSRLHTGPEAGTWWAPGPAAPAGASLCCPLLSGDAEAMPPPPRPRRCRPLPLRPRGAEAPAIRPAPPHRNSGGLGLQELSV